MTTTAYHAKYSIEVHTLPAEELPYLLQFMQRSAIESPNNQTVAILRQESYIVLINDDKGQ